MIRLLKRVKNLIGIIASLSDEHPSLVIGNVRLEFSDDLKIYVHGNLDVESKLTFINCSEEDKEEIIKEYEKYKRMVSEAENAHFPHKEIKTDDYSRRRI
jgi:hypothetical protein